MLCREKIVWFKRFDEFTIHIYVHVQGGVSFGSVFKIEI